MLDDYVGILILGIVSVSIALLTVLAFVPGVSTMLTSFRSDRG